MDGNLIEMLLSGKSSWDQLEVAEGRFSDDVWDLKPLFVHQRRGVEATGKLNFTWLSSKPLIIEPIKRYFYLRLGEVKMTTVSHEYAAFANKIIQFMTEQRIDSLEQFDTARFMAFNQWLKEHLSAEEDAYKPTHIPHTLLQIINIGQQFGFPHVPNEPIILETSLWDWWGANALSQKIRLGAFTDKSIPLSLWRQITQAAWQAPNILQTIQSGPSRGLFRLNHAKFGILIQAYTGLRISEVLYLQRGCVEQDDKGLCWLSATLEKTETEPVVHRILIPASIYQLIKEMEVLTEPLSQEAKESGYLFYLLSKPAKNTTHIKQRYQPRPLESGKWTSTILRPFLET